MLAAVGISGQTGGESAKRSGYDAERMQVHHSRISLFDPRSRITRWEPFGSRPVPRFSDKALEIVKDYSWPGNVRELENLVQRLLVMTEGDFIDVPDLPSAMRFSLAPEMGLNRTLAEVEAEHIRNVLGSVGGNKTRAAETLGIDRKTLREKLKNSGTTKA